MRCCLCCGGLQHVPMKKGYAHVSHPGLVSFSVSLPAASVRMMGDLFCFAASRTTAGQLCRVRSTFGLGIPKRVPQYCELLQQHRLRRRDRWEEALSQESGVEVHLIFSCVDYCTVHRASEEHVSHDVKWGSFHRSCL